MTHDFKFVLDEILDCETHVHIVKNSEAYETIIAALRIADKFMQEPSIDMDNAGYCVGNRAAYCTEIFTAMRDQMLRELNISTDPVSIPSAADTSQNVEYEKD